MWHLFELPPVESADAIHPTQIAFKGNYCDFEEDSGVLPVLLILLEDIE